MISNNESLRETMKCPEKLSTYMQTEKLMISYKKKEEQDFAMASTEKNKDHDLFGCVLKIHFMSVLYKMKIIVLQNNTKGFILGTDILWIRRSSRN